MNTNGCRENHPVHPGAASPYYRAADEGGGARRPPDQEIAQLNAVTSHINATLRRAVRFAVQEARNERKRRQELDERVELKMDRLASAQLLSEEGIEKLGERVDGLGEKLDRLGDKVDKLVDGMLRGPGSFPAGPPI